MRLVLAAPFLWMWKPSVKATPPGIIPNLSINPMQLWTCRDSPVVCSTDPPPQAPDSSRTTAPGSWVRMCHPHSADSLTPHFCGVTSFSRTGSLLCERTKAEGRLQKRLLVSPLRGMDSTEQKSPNMQRGFKGTACRKQSHPYLPLQENS